MSTLKVNTITPLSGGTVTIDGSLVESSALRFKENIQSLEDSSKVMQLRPVTFDWKKDQKHDIGLIAEEVAELYPELVETNGDITGIKYTKLTALLIKTVQEQNARIQKLETQIAKK
jgi:hypothetical protein